MDKNNILEQNLEFSLIDLSNMQLQVVYRLDWLSKINRHMVK